LGVGDTEDGFEGVALVDQGTCADDGLQLWQPGHLLPHQRPGLTPFHLDQAARLVIVHGVEQQELRLCFLGEEGGTTQRPVRA
jgi:hypothetical protein